MEKILEQELLPTTVPELPMVTRMIVGMNSPLVVPSLHEKQQKEFTNGWDPLFIGYSAAVYFHTCDIEKNSWTTQAKNMIGSMPPREEGHIALKDEMKTPRGSTESPTDWRS